MFRLVADIGEYPDFLPWCSDARELRRDGDTVDASIELHKGTIRKSFTTHNIRREGESITIHLLDGPFRQLEGVWKFADLGTQGSKVTLDMEFEFDSRLLDMMFGAFFEETCNSLVDAFIRRAQSVYGPR